MVNSRTNNIFFIMLNYSSKEGIISNFSRFKKPSNHSGKTLSAWQKSVLVVYY